MTATRLQNRNYFENASGGQTAIRNLATSPTYLAHYIEMNVDDDGATDVPNADWANYISEVRVRRNGQDTVKWDVAELLKYNLAFGIPQRAGILPIILTMPYARTLAGEVIGAHTTLGLTHYSVEVDIKAGVTVNTMRLHTKEAAPQQAGPCFNVRRYSGERSATGENVIDEVSPGSYYLAAAILNKTGVDGIEAVVTGKDGNRRKIHDTNLLSREQSYLDSGRVIQSNQTIIDFAPLNQIVSMASGTAVPEILNMDINSLDLEFDWTTAPNAWKMHTIELRNEL
ncbi:major capsid protein P2 [Planktotalea arctica]|uniref:major capsid protein P2 n=1 Tax=Planktotalea arctica TaxID=1481893 RepID=UPI003218FBAE